MTLMALHSPKIPLPAKVDLDELKQWGNMKKGATKEEAKEVEAEKEKPAKKPAEKPESEPVKL